MFQFLSDLQQFNFLQYAVMTGVLASISCGIIGSYVTVRRTTYIAGAIAHCTLGGMGIAGYLSKEQGLVYFTPLVGAVCAALFAALIIAWMINNSTVRLDTVLSAVWAIGMAIGIIFISKTSGYNEDLMSYLFGDILMVSDCSKGRIFQVTSLSAIGSNEIRVNHAASGTPGNSTTSWGGSSTDPSTWFSPGDSEILKLNAYAYFIATGVSGQPTLMRKTNLTTPQELVEGVENIAKGHPEHRVARR